MRLRTILIGVAILAMAFIGATLAMQVLWPAGESSRRPALAEVPPLPPVSRTSTIVAPTVITLGAIRETLEAKAPRDLTGKRDNIASKFLPMPRSDGPSIAVRSACSGKPEAIGVSTVLTGTLRATGQIASTAAGGTRRARRLLGKDLGRTVEKLAGRTSISAPISAAMSRWSRSRSSRRLAAGAEPDHALSSRRRQHDHRRRAAECRQRSAAVLERQGQRADRAAAGAVAERSVPRAGGAAGVGEALPLARDRRRGRRAAELWLEFRPSARSRRSRGSMPSGHAAGRRRGRDPHRPEGVQAGLPVPGDARDRCRRPSRAASPSRCRSMCRSPRSTA